LSNLVYGISSGVPVWLICCPYTVFENDTFDNFADKIDLIRFHLFSADWISLKTIASVVSLDPQFLVLLVLSRTVENVDSMGFVVLMWI